MMVRRGHSRWTRILLLLALLMIAGITETWAAATSPDADRDELGQCKRGYYTLGQTCIPLENRKTPGSIPPDMPGYAAAASIKAASNACL